MQELRRTKLLLIAVILILAGVTAFLTFGWLALTKQKTPETATVLKNNRVELMVQFSKNEIKNFPNIEIKNSEDALILTQRVLGEQEMGLEVKDLGFAKVVEAIGGRGSEPKKNLFWKFYVNGQLATVKADLYQVAGGDLLEWRLGPAEN